MAHTRRFVVAVLLLAIAVPAAGVVDGRGGRAVASTAVPATGDDVGSQDHWLLWEPDAELQADLDAMQRAGMTWVRVSLDWPSIQPVSRTGWNWGPTDRVVVAAGARNLRVLFMAGYAPPWARAAGAPAYAPPVDPADYAAFLRAAAARYAPFGVHDYEIWNEPNNRYWWQPGADPAAYTALLRAAYRALHAADPNAFVVLGGLSPAADGGGDLSPLSFLRGVYAAGGKGSFDAVGLHPYSFPYPPDWGEPWNPFWRAPDLYALMQANGDGGMQVWATEFGVPTGTGPGSVDEATQATQLATALSLWRGFSFAGPLFWFGIRDRGSDPRVIDDNFGLLRRDGTAKPAYVRLRQERLSATGIVTSSVAGASGLDVWWTAPRRVPSGPVTGYTVTASNGASRTVGAAAVHTVLPVAAGTAATVTVRPQFATGPGITSVPSARTIAGAPTLVPLAAATREGNTGFHTVNLPVTLTAPSFAPVTVDYTGVRWPGKFEAWPNWDYVTLSGRLTFAPGVTSATIPITIAGDTRVEPGGNLIMVQMRNLTGANLGGYGIGIVWIQDDD